MLITLDEGDKALKCLIMLQRLLWKCNGGLYFGMYCRYNNNYLSHQFSEMEIFLNLVRDKWYDIGLGLKIKQETLNTIKELNHDDPADCLRTMIKVWFKFEDYLSSWENLAVALKNIDENLAKRGRLINNTIIMLFMIKLLLLAHSKAIVGNGASNMATQNDSNDENVASNDPNALSDSNDGNGASNRLHKDQESLEVSAAWS